MNSNSPETLISVSDLKKHFEIRPGLLSRFRRKGKMVHAVDGVTFAIHKGDVLSLVGESGCGKTTLARLMLRLLRPTEGSIVFDGQDLFKADKKEVQKIRVKMQAVFQDPYASLDPKKTVRQIVAEPLVVNHLSKDSSETFERVSKALDTVGLTPAGSFADKFPYELSGGQRQRVAIARAVVINPHFIVADEPVSMLDVSIRAEILALLLGLKRKLNLSYLFITHDLSVARYVSDRMAVMYLGKIVEIGATDDVCANPVHPYTKALLSAVPAMNPRKRHKPLGLKGEVPDSVEIPTGCRFRPRCPFVFEKCGVEPELMKVGEDHYASCYLAEQAA